MQEHASVSTPRKRFSFDMGAAWALLLSAGLAAIFYLPFANIPTIYTKVSILAIGLLVALAFYILARLTRGNVILPPLALLGALWLIPLAYLLSALFSGVGLERAFFGLDLEADTLGFMLLLTLFATLAALTFRRTAQFRTFFKVGALALGIALVAQILFLIVGRIAPTAVTTTDNLVGSFLDMGMFAGLGVVLLLLALRFLSFSDKARVMLMIGGVVGLLVLALVNSTLIWSLVALVSLGLFIEAIMRNRAGNDEGDLDGVSLLLPEGSEEPAGTPVSRSLALPLVGLIVSLFFLIGGSTIGNALVAAFKAETLDVRPSWQATFDVGSHTYASSPLFGSGPGTFGSEWLAPSVPGNRHEPDRAHPGRQCCHHRHPPRPARPPRAGGIL